MYLRKFTKRKNGKDHTYWGLVESVRLAGKPRQRLVAHLGELSNADCEPYVELVRQLNRHVDNEQPDLFDAQGSIRVVPGTVSVERVQDFGDAWMGLRLWRLLQLDEFFEDRVSAGRERVCWSKMIAWSVIARFCGGASSELAQSESFSSSSSLCDLLGIDPARINEDRLYRTLDEFVKHKSALMQHLCERYRDLFSSKQDLVLYDLTSTYFEGQAEANSNARRGYSRDGRGDAKQVVIALVTTREGLPLACEIFPGNRHDSTTLRTICTVMEKRFGAMERVWVMDRGIASEENLGWLRQRGASYLVGTAKTQLRRFEKQLLQTTDWQKVREGVEVVLVSDPDGTGDTYVVCRSSDRAQKEKAMLERFAARLEQGLETLSAACSRKSNPLRDPITLGKRLGVLLNQNSRARTLFEVTVATHPDGRLQLFWKRASEPTWAELTAGHYLLRASLPSPLDAQAQWKAYIQLTEIESAFRSLKTDLGVRPIYHQLHRRVSAHIQICFLALCLRRCLQLRLEQWNLGSSVAKVLRELKKWKQMDVLLPVTGTHKVLRRRIIATPAAELKILLQRMLLPPPKSQALEPPQTPTL